MKAVGGLVMVGIAVFASAVTPAAAAPKPQVLTFVSYQTSIHDTNSNPATVVIHDKDVSGKKQLGHDVFTCKVNGPKVLGCVAVFSLAKGNISVKSGAGSATDTSTWKPTITRGTGAYAGARGTAVYKTLNQAKGTVQVTLTFK